MFVTWQVPESDGNSPITGYIVLTADEDEPNFRLVGHTDSNTFEYQVNTLDKDKQYLVQVLATNAVGKSEPACHPESGSLQPSESLIPLICLVR